MQQRNIEMSAFMDPEQTFKSGRYGGPKFGPLMPQEYKEWMRSNRENLDIRFQRMANEFEKNVKETFEDLESTMVHVRLPTTKGVRYHSGLSADVFEQTEEPGLVNMHTANHHRLMLILSQFSQYGDYTPEEEQQIDDQELDFVVATEVGQTLISNDGHHRRNNRRFRRDSGKIIKQRPIYIIK